jgi:cytochrome c biogenesis protein CcmG/thiol:disulfide interchange protein DsbE
MIPMEGPVRPSRRRWPRIAGALIPAAAFIALLGFAVAKQGSAPVPGDKAPDFTAPVLGESRTFELSDLAGHPVLLNFWWSGCEPCRKEAPLLERAHRVYGDEVRFVGVNIRDAESDAERFVSRYHLDYLHVRDEGLNIYREYGLTGQPESFFIDSDGVLIEHIPGEMSQDDLYRLLDVLVTRNA